MKHFFYPLFFVFALTSFTLVSAFGFSPSSLEFELSQNKTSCKNIILDSDSAVIEVSDKWALNLEDEWKASLFNEDAQSHGIAIDYDNELGLGEEELEVCLSGSEVGEYHGVILMEEQKQGDSVIQMGVWLKVVITQEVEVALEDFDSRDVDSSTRSPSGSPRSNAVALEENDTQVDTVEESEVDNTSSSTGFVGVTVLKNDEEKRDIVAITGGVIGGESSFGKWGIMFSVAFIGAVVGLVFYGKRRSIV